MTMRIAAVGRTQIGLHPLVLAVLAGACVLGRLSELLMAMLALTLHEAAHAVAAGACGCEIQSVELQPFGGVARISGLNATSRAEWCIYAAGPAASLIIAGVASIACYLAPETGARIEPFLSFNLMLGTVNLLPALPLDGGRIARDVLARRFGDAFALRATSWTGILCGAGMLAAATAAALNRAINLTLPVMGAFLMLAAIREQSLSQERQLASFWQKNDVLRSGGGLDVHLLAAHASMRGAEAFRLMRANRYHLIRVVDSSLRTVGELDEGALMQGLLHLGAHACVGEILSFDRTQRLC